MADKMWDILKFLKNPEGEEAGDSGVNLHSENEKKQINDQLMAALENTEQAIDEAIEMEKPVPAPLNTTPAQSLSYPDEAPVSEKTATPDETAKGNTQETALPEAEQTGEIAGSYDDMEERNVEKKPTKEQSPSPRKPRESSKSKKGDDAGTVDSGKLMRISVARVKPNPFQPRKIMGENEITELSESIKELGVLQPIIVRQAGDAYELIAGERRLRASQRAGLSEIPAMILETEPLTQQIIALVENIQRKNLSAIEEAVCLQDIISKTGWSQMELSRRTGRSQASIANKLRLLRLDQSVQDLVISGKLGERQARSLLSLSVEEQKLLAQKAIDEDLSARALETLAENWNEGDKSARKPGRRATESSEGPGGELLGDIASLIKKHKSRGVSAQWKVKQMDQSALVVEISVDFLEADSYGSEDVE